MKLLNSLFVAFVAASLATSVGCGPYDLATIEGRATFRGAPIVQGAITYENVDGMGSTYGCEIKDGVYRAEKVKFGEKIVKIRAVKVVGKKKTYPEDPQSPMMDVYESFLPAKYNDLTELRLSVDNTLVVQDYDLQ